MDQVFAGLRWVDIAIILATLLGPVLAVQAQKFLERRREAHLRRVWIFRTLMATRAARLSPGHVEALNAIPLEFYGKKYAKINDVWRQYLGILSDREMDQRIWNVKRNDIFIDLLQELASSLDYHFDKAQIAREVYSPEAHSTIENDQDFIRRSVVKLLLGEAAIPMDIRSIASDPTALAEWTEIRQLALQWLRAQQRPDDGDRVRPAHERVG